MSFFRPLFPRWIVWLALPAFLAACAAAGTNGGPRFYLLTPLEKTAATLPERATLVLALSPMDLPQYLNRPQIVTRSGRNELHLAEYHRWGDNLKKNATRVLAENLARRWPTEKVFVSAHQSSIEPPFFAVDVTVLAFERDPAGEVRLEARWIIRRGGTKKALATRVSELAAQPEREGDYPATVAAMSRLLNDLSGEIILELERLTASSR